MEDQVYNTGELTYHQKENFKKFLDDVIGTDFEEESFDGGKYTLTVFDLRPKEVVKIREFENTKLDEPYEKFCVVWKLLKEDATPYRSEWMDDYVEAEDLLGEVVDKLGLKLDPYQMFDFRMIETNIKAEQYKQGILLKDAQEISKEQLKAFCDSVEDDYTIKERINALHIVVRGESSHDFNEFAKDSKEQYKGYEADQSVQVDNKSMTFKQVMAGIFDTAEGTYYKWKKEERPIIKLLVQYFTKEDLQEFLDKGSIKALDEFKAFKDTCENDPLFKQYLEFKEFQEFKQSKEDTVSLSTVSLKRKSRI